MGYRKGAVLLKGTLNLTYTLPGKNFGGVRTPKPSPLGYVPVHTYTSVPNQSYRCLVYKLKIIQELRSNAIGLK